MKRCLMTMCFVALAVSAALAQQKKTVPLPPKPADEGARALPPTQSQLVQIGSKVELSVVAIFGESGIQSAQSTVQHDPASGVIVDPKGYILTIRHVVDEAERIRVKLPNDAPDVLHDAKIIGMDARTDLVVIKIDTDKPLPTARLSNSDGVRLGDWLLPVGFHSAAAITAGIVSGRGYGVLPSRSADPFIRLDASINRHNSGGPVVDMAGQVVGIGDEVVGASSLGIGYVLPTNSVVFAYNQLIGPQHRVVRGTIGIMFSTDDTTTSSNGLLLTDVLSGGPADQAGLKRGNILLSINGKKIRAYGDFFDVMPSQRPGSMVSITFRRDSSKSETLETQVAVADSEKSYAGLHNRDDSPPPRADASPKSADERVASAGYITGTVKFDGTTPHQRLIDMSKEPSCAAVHGDKPATTESVVVGAAGELANVVVYITQGLTGSEVVSSQPVQIDQKGCQYVPHVVAVDAGQHMKILNSDQTPHNIHPHPTNNLEWNKSQPPGAPPLDVSWPNEGIAPVRCNIHPWMLAYIVVVKGPYAVSDYGGSFRLDNIPPGSYTLTAWHEIYGTQMQNVTVTAEKPGTVSFIFKATQAATDATGTPQAASQNFSRAQSRCNSLDQVVQIDEASGLASGPGHCTGEADFWFTNTSAQAIDCTIIFHKNGRFDPASALTFTLSPGEKLGGTGKISTCGADTGEMQHYCFSHAENAAANCTGQVQWDK